jgi:RHS repeat-associated protein
MVYRLPCDGGGRGCESSYDGRHHSDIGGRSVCRSARRVYRFARWTRNQEDTFSSSIAVLAETNLYNYFRDYDPAVGRYEQSDPIGLRGGPNTYSYGKSAPSRWIDSKGLFSPLIHWQLSFNALMNCPKLRFAASRAAVAVDREDGSQEPAQAHWHAMCRPGEDPVQGKAWIESMIDYQIGLCSVDWAAAGSVDTNLS